MNRGLDVSVFVNMANNLAKPLKDAEGKVKDSTDRMRKSLTLSLKLGGAGLAATGIKVATNSIIQNFTQSTKEIQRATGDLRALGMQDIQAVVREGRRLQNTYVGLTTEAFVRAAYDIRSGVSSLTDEGVAAMTAAALTVAKATKGVPESMTSLFATSYGIFKKQFADMSDADFGDMFGAALAKSVQQFKTDGAKMQQAIESAGAGATNLGMSMIEQLTLLGMMQQQMSAGEAGTALKSFVSNAAKAHEAFQDMKITAKAPVRVKVLDVNGQMRAMPDILSDIKARYGETLDAFEAAEIKKAFGTDEAMKLIDALYGQADAVRANADALEEAAQQGAEFTANMAADVDDYDGAGWEKFQQQLKSIKEEVGEGLLPALDALAVPMANIAQIVAGFVQENPKLVTGFGSIVAGLFGIASTAAPILYGSAALVNSWAALSLGSSKLAVGLLRIPGLLLGMLNPLKLVRGAFIALRFALISTGIGAIAVGLATAGLWVYNNWSGLSAMFSAFGRALYNSLGPAKPLVDGLSAGVTRLTGWISTLVGPIDASAAQWEAWGDKAGRAIGDAIAGILGFDWQSLLTLDGLKAAWSGITRFIGPAFATLWDTLNPLSWTGLVKADDLKSAWDNIKSTLQDYTPHALILKSWDTVTTWFADRWETIKSGVTTGWDAIKNGFATYHPAGIIYTHWETISDWFSALWDKVKTTFTTKWDEIRDALDIRDWFNFAWSDVLPDWDWGAIIPELPDLKGMFTDASETIDVRLENRASNVMGREWQEGLDLIADYRQGLIDIEEVRARLAAKVATESGAMFNSFEVNRAEDMLALLQEIEATPATLPEIKDPETLVEAARAAEDLAQQYPVLTAAAQETQAVVSASMSQMISDLQTTSLVSEGQRLMQSLAQGIRSQRDTVTAAVEDITRSIQNALPKSAHLQIAATAGPALAGQKVQARARGGSFNAGWLLTGEEGPELRYASKGGFIAHHRALRGMLDMAGQARRLVTGLDLGSLTRGLDIQGLIKSSTGAAIGTGALATAAAAGPQVGAVDFKAIAAQIGGHEKQVTITMNPTYHIPINGDVSTDMEARLRQILTDHMRQAQHDLESLFDD